MRRPQRSVRMLAGAENRIPIQPGVRTCADSALIEIFLSRLAAKLGRFGLDEFDVNCFRQDRRGGRAEKTARH